MLIQNKEIYLNVFYFQFSVSGSSGLPSEKGRRAILHTLMGLRNNRTIRNSNQEAKYLMLYRNLLQAEEYDLKPRKT